MNFSKNLRYLRKKYQHSQDDLAKQLGYKSFTTIQKWEDGSSKPSYSIIMQIANMYNVQVDDIMNKNIENYAPVNIPILGTVRGGDPILAEENITGYENVMLEETENGEYFYLEVVGDSMKDVRILPGDILYIKKQNYLNNKDIGIILIDNEATVKRVIYKNDNMILQPENDNYKPIILTKEDLANGKAQILGKVVHNKIKF